MYDKIDHDNMSYKRGVILWCFWGQETDIFCMYDFVVVYDINWLYDIIHSVTNKGGDLVWWIYVHNHLKYHRGFREI